MCPALWLLASNAWQRPSVTHRDALTRSCYPPQCNSITPVPPAGAARGPTRACCRVAAGNVLTPPSARLIRHGDGTARMRRVSDAAHVHPWCLQRAMLRVQHCQLGNAGCARAACGLSARAYAIFPRLQPTRLRTSTAVAVASHSCAFGSLCCASTQDKRPNHAPLSPRRYAYGAQSVKCAVCNFVTQARLPPTACSSHPMHVAHIARRLVCPQGGAASTLPPPGSAGGASSALTAFALHALAGSVFTPCCASGNRPQPRPQMVVVENPPTVDDEGKMARARALPGRSCRAFRGLHFRPQVSNMAVGVAQK